jgi:hypothetical protein
VAPDASATHSFAVRATAVPAGAVTVQATRTGDGATASHSASYAARNCG